MGLMAPRLPLKHLFDGGARLCQALNYSWLLSCFSQGSTGSRPTDLTGLRCKWLQYLCKRYKTESAESPEGTSALRVDRRIFPAGKMFCSVYS
jgi:hypothetical protein